MPSIQPNVLVWARETAGLSLDDAAEKIGLRGEAASERLRAIDLGQREPSRAQLLKMSKAYRCSLLTLYLAASPAKGDRGQDFRTLPQQQTPNDQQCHKCYKTRAAIQRITLEIQSVWAAVR